MKLYRNLSQINVYPFCFKWSAIVYLTVLSKFCSSLLIKLTLLLLNLSLCPESSSPGFGWIYFVTPGVGNKVTRQDRLAWSKRHCFSCPLAENCSYRILFKVSAHVHRSFTIAVPHTFGTLLRLPSLTPPATGSDHLPPGLLSRSLEDVLFPFLGRPCGTGYRLNFDSSTVDVRFIEAEVAFVPISF